MPSLHTYHPPPHGPSPPAVTPSYLETHYHSVEISGSNLSAGALFTEMKKFSTLDFGPITPSNNIGGVGSQVSFDMDQIYTELGQGDFTVEVNQITPQQHEFLFVRLWGIRSQDGGCGILTHFRMETCLLKPFLSSTRRPPLMISSLRLVA